MEQKVQKLEGKMDKLLEKFKLMETLNSNMKILHESQEALSKDNDDFRGKLDLFFKEFKDIKKQVEFIQAENVYLKSELKLLRNALEDSFCDSKAADLEIVGIPPAQGENLKQKVLDIAAKIGVPVPENQIKYVSRKLGRNGKQGYVTVKFFDKEIRSGFLEKARRAKLIASDFGHVGLSNKLFFNECLSLYSKNLLFKAREFRNNENWKYVWVKEGKIYLRKADKEPAVRIASEGDLYTLKK